MFLFLVAILDFRHMRKLYTVFDHINRFIGVENLKNENHVNGFLGVLYTKLIY